VEGIDGHDEIEEAGLEGQGLHVGLGAFERGAERQQAVAGQKAVVRVEARVERGHPVARGRESGRGPRAAGAHLEHAPRRFAEGVGREADPLVETLAPRVPERRLRVRARNGRQAGSGLEARVAPQAVLHLQEGAELGPARLLQQAVDAAARGEVAVFLFAHETGAPAGEGSRAIGTAPALAEGP
jgi:hypothetical protein